MDTLPATPLAMSGSSAMDEDMRRRLAEHVDRNGLTDPAGVTTTITPDALGRDSLVLTPIDASHTGWTRTIYDAMDRPIRTVTFGPAMSGASADSVVLTNTYDEEGNLETVTRTRGVHAPSATLVWYFQWDEVGRKVSETNANATQDYQLDPAGNVTVITSWAASR